MSRAIPTLITAGALALTLTACSTGPSEEEMKQAITDACEADVKDFAKYPREAEMIDPIEGAVRDAEDGQGPNGTTKVSVNFGVVAFANGFGVKSDYRYGCVAYLNDEGEVLDTQALAKEDGTFLSGIVYIPSEDRLQ